MPAAHQRLNPCVSKSANVCWWEQVPPDGEGRSESGFLWQNGVLTDLHTYPRDHDSLALDINDSGVVVGASQDSNFTPRALVWENGNIFDLNAISNSAMYLVFASSINAAGVITGLGVTANGLHGFLAKPDRDHSPVSKRVTRPILSDGDSQAAVASARNPAPVAPLGPREMTNRTRKPC